MREQPPHVGPPNRSIPRSKGLLAAAPTAPPRRRSGPPSQIPGAPRNTAVVKAAAQRYRGPRRPPHLRRAVKWETANGIDRGRPPAANTRAASAAGKPRRPAPQPAAVAAGAADAGFMGLGQPGPRKRGTGSRTRWRGRGTARLLAAGRGGEKPTTASLVAGWSQWRRGMTAWIEVEKGDLESGPAVLDWGANPSTTDTGGRAATAATTGNTFAKFMLDGAPTEQGQQRRWTPLYIAIDNRNIEAATIGPHRTGTISSHQAAARAWRGSERTVKTTR